MDDALCERYTKCFLCRQALGQGRFDTFVVGGVVVLVTRCHRCARSDPTGDRVLKVLAQRDDREPRGAGPG